MLGGVFACARHATKHDLVPVMAPVLQPPRACTFGLSSHPHPPSLSPPPLSVHTPPLPLSERSVRSAMPCQFWTRRSVWTLHTPTLHSTDTPPCGSWACGTPSGQPARPGREGGWPELRTLVPLGPPCPLPTCLPFRHPHPLCHPRPACLRPPATLRSRRTRHKVHARRRRVRVRSTHGLCLPLAMGRGVSCGRVGGVRMLHQQGVWRLALGLRRGLAAPAAETAGWRRWVRWWRRCGRSGGGARRPRRRKRGESGTSTAPPNRASRGGHDSSGRPPSKASTSAGGGRRGEGQRPRAARTARKGRAAAWWQPRPRRRGRRGGVWQGRRRGVTRDVTMDANRGATLSAPPPPRLGHFLESASGHVDPRSVGCVSWENRVFL